MFEHITASEIAGYGVGALLLCATISAPKIDSPISSSQRSSLGMCKRSGDVRLIACSKCKGQALIKGGGVFGFDATKDLSQSFEVISKKNCVSCKTCRAKGHFSCPECSKIPQV